MCKTTITQVYLLEIQTFTIYSQFIKIVNKTIQSHKSNQLK